MYVAEERGNDWIYLISVKKELENRSRAVGQNSLTFIGN